MSSLREVLEAALVENPDDLAAHRAYADLLAEQGDPRGEFIQVQLALEDPELSAADRQQLKRREQKLLAAHCRDWLGTLADELLGTIQNPWAMLAEEEKPYEFRFVRGWLHRIVRHQAIRRGQTHLARALRQAPEARLLRELVLESADDRDEELVHAPCLSNVRVFLVGPPFAGVACHPFVPDLVAHMPRIEKLLLRARSYDVARLFALPNVRNLRMLQIFSLDVPHPLEILADNPALGELTHLLLYPPPALTPMIDLAGVRALVQSPHLRSLTHLQLRCSDLGDVGCTEIVTSGVLKRLKVLDLRHGTISDAGARILASCPDLARLERLDVGRNGLTQAGIDALFRVLGPALHAENQQTPAELLHRQYLFEGDYE